MDAEVAQLVELLPSKQKVSGSSPVLRSISLKSPPSQWVVPHQSREGGELHLGQLILCIPGELPPGGITDQIPVGVVRQIDGTRIGSTGFHQLGQPIGLIIGEGAGLLCSTGQAQGLAGNVAIGIKGPGGVFGQDGPQPLGIAQEHILHLKILVLLDQVDQRTNSQFFELADLLLKLL